MTPWTEAETTKLFCPICGHNHLFFYTDNSMCAKCDWEGKIDDLIDIKRVRKDKLKKIYEQ